MTITMKKNPLPEMMQMYPNLNYREHTSPLTGDTKAHHKWYNLEHTVPANCYGAAQLHSRNCPTKDALPEGNEQLQ